MDPATISHLDEFVQSRRGVEAFIELPTTMTRATLLQGAWASVLGAAAGLDDVVYGTTVSGRPPELAGVEQMVGLFINTLPLRVSADEL